MRFSRVFFSLMTVLLALNGFSQSPGPTYNVADFGAIGDGKTDDRMALQKAIDACGKTGGTVVLKNGTFMTGQLMLKSNITIYIDSSATLLGIRSDEEADYPHHLIQTKYPNRMLQDCQRRLLYGDRVHDVTITGKGTINGQGDHPKWMNVAPLGSEKDRPSLFAFVASKNINLSDLTLLYPACWTQVYIESDNIHIKGIKVNTGKLTPNRDGIDIVDCHNVLIENCFIQSEDDGICLKSGSEYGCDSVFVKNCIVDKLNVKPGNCIKLGTDGLGYFKNIDFTGLKMMNAFSSTGIVIESVDGAVIDNVSVSNSTIENCGQAIFIVLGARMRTVPGRKPRIGTISNIIFRNITGSNFTHPFASIITGIPGHHVQNVSFENVDLALKGGVDVRNQTVHEYEGDYPEGNKFGNTNAFGFFIRHTDSVSFKDCHITSVSKDARPWLITENVGQVSN